MTEPKEKQIRHLYALIHNGFTTMAIDILDLFIQEEYREPRWLAEKMGLLADTCQWGLFYETQQKIITDFPGTAEAYLAQALNPGGKITRRIAFLTRAIEQDPLFAKLYYYRGLAFRDLNCNPQAIMDFSEGLALEPGNYALNFYRAKAYQANGEYYAAFKDLMTYLMSPLCDDRVPLLDEMILVLGKMKELDQAIDQTLQKQYRYWLDDSSGLKEESKNDTQHLSKIKRGKMTRDELLSAPNDPDPG